MAGTKRTRSHTPSPMHTMITGSQAVPHFTVQAPDREAPESPVQTTVTAYTSTTTRTALAVASSQGVSANSQYFVPRTPSPALSETSTLVPFTPPEQTSPEPAESALIVHTTSTSCSPGRQTPPFCARHVVTPDIISFIQPDDVQQVKRYISRLRRCNTDHEQGIIESEIGRGNERSWLRLNFARRILEFEGCCAGSFHWEDFLEGQ